MKKFRLFIVLLLFFPLTIFASSQSTLKNTITFFSSFPTRMPGTPSYYQSADYIYQYFISSGLTDVKKEEFKTVVPIQKQAELKSGNITIPLDALWPNSVRTCSTGKKGITGSLIYYSEKNPASINGKIIAGNIIVMKFNSGNEWITLAGLGARAIIFLAPDNTNRIQAEDKFLNVPVNVPRFYILKKYTSFITNLIKSSSPVNISAKVLWKNAPSYNIYGFIKGTDPILKKQLILIESYYDSISVVPSIAPGAEASDGISSLLRLVKYFQENPPKRSILFLACSSHFEYNKGIDAFIQRHLRTAQPFKSQTKISFSPAFAFCLDLSSHSNQIGVWDNLYEENPYELSIRGIMAPYAKEIIKYGQQAASLLGYSSQDEFVNGVTPEKGIVWKNYLPGLIKSDGGFLILDGVPTLSFITVNDARDKIDTPFDTANFVNYQNLEQQYQLIKNILSNAVNNSNFFSVGKISLQDHLANLTVKSVIFNPTKGFVPNQPVTNAIVLPRFIPGTDNPPQKTYFGVRGDIFDMTNKKGDAVVTQFPVGVQVLIQAYYSNPKNGNIIYSSDFGIYGDQQYPMLTSIGLNEMRTTNVLFRCKAINLFNLIDPRYLIPLESLDIFNLTNTIPDSYGYYLENPKDTVIWKWTSKSEPVGVVFAKPNSFIKIAGIAGAMGIRLLLLNSTLTITNKSEAEGKGFNVNNIISINNVPYQSAIDMYALDHYRTHIFKKYNIVNTRLDQLQRYAKKLIAKAELAYKEKSWEQFLSFSRQAQAIESRAYPDVKSTSDDVVKGLIFYFMLLLPFAYFCERLFFGFAKIEKRIAGIFGIFIVIYIIMRFVDPAFKLTSSPEIILLAFIIFALSLVVIAIIASKFEEQMQKFKKESNKVYQTDVGRITATGTAFSLGVANMKKRKTRTLLTGITIVLLTFTVLSFTSIKSYMKFNQIMRSNKPLYNGLLLRDRAWNPLQTISQEYVNSEFKHNGIIAERYWYLIGLSNPTFIQISSGNKNTYASSLLGLTSQETEITHVNKCLIAGKWLTSGEKNVIILPEKIADALGISPGDIGKKTVRIYGEKLIVQGIFNSKQFNKIKDLDNEPLAPVSFSALPQEEISKMKMEQTAQVTESVGKIKTFVHLSSSNVPIVPVAFVKQLGGTLQSIAVKFYPGQDIKKLVEDFISKLAVTIFVGNKGKVSVYSSMGLTSISGVASLIIPILIAALIILNTMLGSVYERMREIGTYSAVGLAPVHIASLFFAESGVFAVLGAVGGYLLGQIVTKFLIYFHLLKGISLNYSSLSAVFATIVIIATVLLSTLYPARKASQMSVPDVTRRWSMPEPKGDNWKFQFPFTVSEIEVLGLITFLNEYFNSYQDVSLGYFYTSGASLTNNLVGNRNEYITETKIWLAPFDLGVSQSMKIIMKPMGQYNFYTIDIELNRLSGEANDWKRLNRRFIDGIRKQFLVWRTVSPDIKKDYESQGRIILKIA